MRRLASVLVLLAVVLAGAGPVHAQQTRQALLLGNNEGNDPARALRYAEQEVTRLGDVLKRSGDFDVVDVLRGSSRSEIEQALKQIHDRLARSRKAGQSTLFLFYYTGHGDNEALELGATRLPLRDLRGYLERLPADVRLAFVDACQSGALTGVKGGRRAPGYDVRLADTGNVKGLAVVTSSTANELSQESEDLRGSYFTHNLMAGLQGLADSSRDGQVTLAELYDFAFRRTLANTAANLAGGQHPTYDFRMSGTGDVILTRVRAKDGRLRFPREVGATYTVFSRGDVTAELTTNAGDELYLAVPAGHYRVVRRALVSISERTIELESGATVTLEPQEMIPLLASADEILRKKGDAGAAEGPAGAGEVWNPSRVPEQMLEAHVGVGTRVVTGGDPLMASAGLAYGRRVGGLSLRARGELAAFNAETPGYRSSLLRLLPALDLLLPVVTAGRFSLQLGPSLGMPYVRQSADDGTHQSFGFRYGGVALALLRLSSSAWLTAALDGGGEIFRLDRKNQHTPVAGFAVGGAVGF